MCTSILSRAFGEQIACGCPTSPMTMALETFPWKAFATKTEKLEDEVLGGFTGKTKHTKTKTQHHHRQNKEILSERVDSSHTDVQRQGGSFPFIQGGNRGIQNEQNKEEERRKERERRKEGRKIEQEGRGAKVDSQNRACRHRATDSG